MGRDLVKEMEERRADAASTATSSVGSHHAASSAGAAADNMLTPTSKAKSRKVEEDPWQVREQVAEAVFSDMDSVLVVDVGNDLQDSIINSDNTELVVACEALKGSYFFTGQHLNGYPVWKQVLHVCTLLIRFAGSYWATDMARASRLAGTVLMQYFHQRRTCTR